MNAIVRRDTSFSTIRSDNAPRRLKINPTEEKLTSLIAASTVIEGNLRFKEGVKIDGRVKGDVSFGIDDGIGIIALGAIVEGNFKGPRALIMGEVEGNIEVEGTLVLAPTAVVVGAVRCGRIIVYDGASVTGNIEMIRLLPEDQVLGLEVTAVTQEREAVLPFRRKRG